MFMIFNIIFNKLKIKQKYIIFKNIKIKII